MVHTLMIQEERIRVNRRMNRVRILKVLVGTVVMLAVLATPVLATSTGTAVNVASLFPDAASGELPQGQGNLKEEVPPVLPGTEASSAQDPEADAEQVEPVLPLQTVEPARDGASGPGANPGHLGPPQPNPVQPDPPPVQPEPAQLQVKPVVLASYTTSLVGSPVNRTHNIRLAAKKISGRVLAPGEIFSFNRIVGPRTKQTGFKSAMVIANRRFVPGIGGGVCQVASTLYNVVLNAKMHVVERYPHSLSVKYVPRGRDASVYYGRADFKFKNNRPFPVRVIAVVTGKTLTISLVK